MIVILEESSCEIKPWLWGRDKHASGLFEVENQRPKKGIKDDKMSV